MVQPGNLMSSAPLNVMIRPWTPTVQSWQLLAGSLWHKSDTVQDRLGSSGVAMGRNRWSCNALHAQLSLTLSLSSSQVVTLTVFMQARCSGAARHA